MAYAKSWQKEDNSWTKEPIADKKILQYPKQWMYNQRRFSDMAHKTGKSGFRQ